MYIHILKYFKLHNHCLTTIKHLNQSRAESVKGIGFSSQMALYSRPLFLYLLESEGVIKVYKSFS